MKTITATAVENSLLAEKTAEHLLFQYAITSGKHLKKSKQGVKCKFMKARDSREEARHTETCKTNKYYIVNSVLFQVLQLNDLTCRIHILNFKYFSVYMRLKSYNGA